MPHYAAIWRIINTLNAHKHDAFRTIAFSDTLLVYNVDAPINRQERWYLTMFLCEFAQDLFYRLIGRDVHFRAYLTKGEFHHRELENMEAFYGEALIRAYQREKAIESTGLFMDNDLLVDSDVFQCDAYDANCSFVHLMQSLDETNTYGEDYPMPPVCIDDTDAKVVPRL